MTKRVEIIVQKHDNDGKDFSKVMIDGIHSDLLDITGGLTTVDSTGEWKNNAMVFVDHNILFMTDVHSDKAVQKLRDYAKTLKIKLGQKSIYFATYPIKVEFL